MDIVWDGFVQAERQGQDELQRRHSLADAARRYDWDGMLGIVCAHGDLVNTTRPGGASLYAPLHQAAHGGAPPEVVAALVRMGAWRMLQNARGERPVDVAKRRGQEHLLPLLEPLLERRVPHGVLLRVQEHFHAVIIGRARQEVEEFGLRLPELGPMLEFRDEKFWFAVPGMYGGFSYRLDSDGMNAKLVSESWCRVSEGSGQRHEITSSGTKLVDEGFV